MYWDIKTDKELVKDTAGADIMMIQFRIIFNQLKSTHGVQFDLICALFL